MRVIIIGVKNKVLNQEYCKKAGVSRERSVRTTLVSKRHTYTHRQARDLFIEQQLTSTFTQKETIFIFVLRAHVCVYVLVWLEWKIASV